MTTILFPNSTRSKIFLSPKFYASGMENGHLLYTNYFCAVHHRRLYCIFCPYSRNFIAKNRYKIKTAKRPPSSSGHHLCNFMRARVLLISFLQPTSLPAPDYVHSQSLLPYSPVNDMILERKLYKLSSSVDIIKS